MEEDAPRINRHSAPADPGVLLSGCWTAARLAEPEIWSPIQAALAACTATEVADCIWDLRALQRLDHTGAQVLWNAWHHQWPTRLLMRDSHRSMLTRVAQYSMAPPVVTRTSAWQVFLSLGARVWRLIDHVLGLVRLTGQLLLDT